MPKRRRKNPQPQRVLTEEESDTELENTGLVFPEDPAELKKYLEEQPIENLFEFHTLPQSCFEQFIKKDANEIDILVCEFCKKEFISKPGVKHHILNTCLENRFTRYTCLICQRKFEKEYIVRDHITGNIYYS